MSSSFVTDTVQLSPRGSVSISDVSDHQYPARPEHLDRFQSQLPLALENSAAHHGRNPFGDFAQHLSAHHLLYSCDRLNFVPTNPNIPQSRPDVPQPQPVHSDSDTRTRQSEASEPFSAATATYQRRHGRPRLYRSNESASARTNRDRTIADRLHEYNRVDPAPPDRDSVPVDRTIKRRPLPPSAPLEASQTTQTTQPTTRAGSQPGRSNGGGSSSRHRSGSRLRSLITGVSSHASESPSAHNRMESDLESQAGRPSGRSILGRAADRIYSGLVRGNTRESLDPHLRKRFEDLITLRPPGLVLTTWYEWYDRWMAKPDPTTFPSQDEWFACQKERLKNHIVELWENQRRDILKARGR